MPSRRSFILGCFLVLATATGFSLAHAGNDGGNRHRGWNPKFLRAGIFLRYPIDNDGVLVSKLSVKLSQRQNRDYARKDCLALAGVHNKHLITDSFPEKLSAEVISSVVGASTKAASLRKGTPRPVVIRQLFNQKLLTIP